MTFSLWKHCANTAIVINMIYFCVLHTEKYTGVCWGQIGRPGSSLCLCPAPILNFVFPLPRNSCVDILQPVFGWISSALPLTCSFTQRKLWPGSSVTNIWLKELMALFCLSCLSPVGFYLLFGTGWTHYQFLWALSSLSDLGKIHDSVVKVIEKEYKGISLLHKH